jgi:hypothetical protein
MDVMMFVIMFDAALYRGRCLAVAAIQYFAGG